MLWETMLRNLWELMKKNRTDDYIRKVVSRIALFFSTILAISFLWKFSDPNVSGSLLEAVFTIITFSSVFLEIALCVENRYRKQKANLIPYGFFVLCIAVFVGFLLLMFNAIQSN